MKTEDRPNFVVVEGDSTTEFSDIYEDFKKDYLDENTTVKEIRNKYDLSNPRYNRIRKLVAEETGVNRKVSKNVVGTRWIHDRKFIDLQRNTGKYRVSKVRNGSYMHCGVYDDLDTAIYVRNKMIEHNWDAEYYKELKYELFGKKDKDTQEEVKKVYDDYKKDFLNGESTKYMKKKYGLTNHMSKLLSRMVRSETGLQRKPQLPIRVRKQHERDIGL